MQAPDTPLISGDALKAAAGKYLAQLQPETVPLGIFDKWFVRVLTRLYSFDANAPWEDSVRHEITRLDAKAGQALQWDFVRLRLFLDRWRQGRFVAYGQREACAAHYDPKYGTEFGNDVLLTCQGTDSLLQWRGLPLMKTVFDFALYPQLLAELKPATIFEIGSGSGASALFLADHMDLLKLPCAVHSVDLIAPTITQHHVAFYQGDCSHPARLFPADVLQNAPHPWLVIEDAHHNVQAVLNHFHTFLKEGDYLYVEDSEIKRDALRGFLGAYPDCYQVDTRYTDFFGRNATCALDSIFIRCR